MSLSIREHMQWAVQILNGLSDTARLDAEILLSKTLQQTRSFLHAWPEYVVPDNIAAQFQSFIQERARGKPVAYLLGQKEFWSLTLEISADTLVPRPETESMVEFALQQFPAAQTISVADLGTGCGAIAIAIAYERMNWSLHATDMNKNALAIAGKNAQQLKLNNITFSHGNWCTALNDLTFDMIVSNPPYISMTEWQTYGAGLQYEPFNALVAEDEGLRDITIICTTAKQHLKQNGLLMIEHGFSQGPSVRQLFHASGYSGIQTHIDTGGRERFTVGKFFGC